MQFSLEECKSKPPLYTSDLALRVGRRRGSFEFPKIWFHLTHSYGLIPECIN